LYSVGTKTSFLVIHILFIPLGSYVLEYA